MAKAVEKVKGGLKLRAAKAKKASLSLKIGVKKYELPLDAFEARYINSDRYIFVHIPPAAELLEISDGKASLMSPKADATEALASFRTVRTRRKRAKTEIPDNIKEILRQIPAGFKIAYSADGSPRLVKTRKRKTK
ncbi:MAG: hypothetical protein HONBIEJF_02444 [Fimbriimonadaceae bacterium]|nr:hypothetical protein [Fimbriimonadaceae bacterium]